jgi:hypothetical protein
VCSHSAQGDIPPDNTPPNKFQGKPDTASDSGTIHEPLPPDCKQSGQEGERSCHLTNECWQQAFIRNNHLARVVLATARMASQLLTRQRRPSRSCRVAIPLASDLKSETLVRVLISGVAVPLALDLKSETLVRVCCKFSQDS